MRNKAKELFAALLAVLAFAAAAWPIRANTAELQPARLVISDIHLFCLTREDANKMAQAMVDAGEGSAVVPRPKSCYLNRINYLIEGGGIVGLHSKDGIWIEVIEVPNASNPEQKYYIIMPTRTLPRGFRSS